MTETLAPRFLHPHATVVTLDGVEFFADSMDFKHSDEHVGQALCGFAFDAGRAVALAARRALWGEPVTDYEFSGWNGGAGI